MEPRTSTFSVGQQVEVKHSNTKYDKRKGLISHKVGGGTYTVLLSARTRTVNGPTGHPRTVTDAAESKNLRLSTLTLIPGSLNRAGAPTAGLQTSLFNG